mgnify:CR=1 FL=1|jgi:hypothetical protein
MDVTTIELFMHAVALTMIVGGLVTAVVVLIGWVGDRYR